MIGGKLDKTGATHRSNDFNRWFALNKEDPLVELRRTVVEGLTLTNPVYNVLSEHAGDISRLFLDVDVTHGDDHTTVFGLHVIGSIIGRFISEIKKASFVKVLSTVQDLKPWTSTPNSAIGLWNVFPDWKAIRPTPYDPYAAIITARPASLSTDEGRFNFHIVFPFLFIQRHRHFGAISKICKALESCHKGKLDCAPVQMGMLRSVYQGKDRSDKLVYDLYGGYVNGCVYMKHEEPFCRYFDLPTSHGRLYGMERPPAEYTDTDGEIRSNQLAMHHYMDHSVWIVPEEAYAKIWSMTSILPDYKAQVSGKPGNGFNPGSVQHGSSSTVPPQMTQSVPDVDSDSERYYSPVAAAHSPDLLGEAAAPDDADYITPYDGVLELFNLPAQDSEETFELIRVRLAKHFMCNTSDSYSPATLRSLMDHAYTETQGSVAQIAEAVARIAALYINRFAAIVILPGGQLPVYVRMPASEGRRCVYTVLYEKSFLQMFALDDLLVVTDGKIKEKVRAAKAWMASRYRLTFDGVGMYIQPPPGTRPFSILNLWKGIRFTRQMCDVHKNYTLPATDTKTKKEFSVETIKFHIYKWLCHGDAVLYSYVINWCAHLLQKPLVKTQTSILFSSEEGTGKGIITSMLCYLIGEDHSLTISNSKDMFGDFAGHLVTLILVVFDEVSYLNAAQRGQLKALVSDGRMRVEKKNVDTRFTHSFLNLIMNTNLNVKDGKGALMDIGPQERRTVMITCDSSVNSPHCAPYFADLHRYIFEGGKGARAFGAYLYSINIDDFTPAPIPITKLAVESKLASANMPHQYWFSALTNGAFKWDVTVECEARMSLSDAKSQVFSRADIYDAFKNWCHDQHNGKVPADQVFWSAIELVCKFTTGRNYIGERRVRSAALPSIADMRAQFSRFYRGTVFEPEQDEAGNKDSQTTIDKYVAPVLELHGKTPNILRGGSTELKPPSTSPAPVVANVIQPVLQAPLSPVLQMDCDESTAPAAPIVTAPKSPEQIALVRPYLFYDEDSSDEVGYVFHQK